MEPNATRDPYQWPSDDDPLLPPEEDLLPLASRGARLGAVLLDGLAFGASLVPGAVLLGMSGGAQDTFLGIGILVMVLGGLALVGYQCYVLAQEGQTIGKRVLHLRIVNVHDGGNPGFVQAVMMRTFMPTLIGFVPLVGFLFAIVDPLFIFREDRRCIHDLFAGTCVVDISDEPAW